MTFNMALIAFLAIGVPAKDDPPDDAKKVLENLQGEWQMVRADFGKNPPPPDAKVGQTRLVIQGNKLLIRMMDGNGKEETATFETNLTKKPFAIDIYSETPKGGARNITVKGIFEVSAETLQLTLGQPGAERPAALNGSDGARATLVFQRVRPK
jgi:uncharacterized protein (TIGR03067 family)